MEPARGDGVVIHGQIHHLLAGNDRRRGPARNHPFELASVLHAAGHLEQFGKRRAHGNLEHPRVVDIAGDGKKFGTAAVLHPDVRKPLPALLQDHRDRGQGLGIVDDRGPAIETVLGRERGFEAGLTLLAFDRFQQRGLLAADIGAGAEMGVAARNRSRNRGYPCPESPPCGPLPGPLRSVRRVPRTRRGCSCNRRSR